MLSSDPLGEVVLPLEQCVAEDRAGFDGWRPLAACDKAYADDGISCEAIDLATVKQLNLVAKYDVGDEETYVEDAESRQKVFGLNAEDQYDHIFRVLQEYGYTEEQLASMEEIVEFVTGDNCATNKSMCRRADIPFIGCKSHLLNLDVQNFIGSEAKTGRKRKADEDASSKRQLITKVDKVMGKMLTIKNAAIVLFDAEPAPIISGYCCFAGSQ